MLIYYKMNLGKRLKETRVKKGLSQGEVAKMVGIHYTQIGRYENKGAQPAADVLAKLADVFNVSSDFLMYGSSKEVANNKLSDKELLNQFHEVEQLSVEDKNIIKTLIEAFLLRRKLQKMV